MTDSNGNNTRNRITPLREVFHQVTTHKFIQLETDLLLEFTKPQNTLKATDTQLLFYLLGHIQAGNKVYLPMYSKFATTDASDNTKLQLSKKNISLGTSRLRELDIIKKVKNGEFMFNPDFVYVGNHKIHHDVLLYYKSINDPKASERYRLSFSTHDDGEAQE